MIEFLIILGLSFIQNVSFSMASRSRNRDNFTYHATCAVFSNGIWFLTLKMLVVAELSWTLLIPYVIGTVLGSLVSAKVSIKIEKAIGAMADPRG